MSLRCIFTIFFAAWHTFFPPRSPSLPLSPVSRSANVCHAAFQRHTSAPEWHCIFLIGSQGFRCWDMTASLHDAYINSSICGKHYACPLGSGSSNRKMGMNTCTSLSYAVCSPVLSRPCLAIILVLIWVILCVLQISFRLRITILPYLQAKDWMRSQLHRSFLQCVCEMPLCCFRSMYSGYYQWL